MKSQNSDGLEYEVINTQHGKDVRIIGPKETHVEPQVTSHDETSEPF